MGSLYLSAEELFQDRGSKSSMETRGAFFAAIQTACSEESTQDVLRTLLDVRGQVSVARHDGASIGFSGSGINPIKSMRLQLAGFLRSLGAESEYGSRGRAQAVLDMDASVMQLPRLVVQGGHRTDRRESRFVRDIFTEFARRATGAVVITGGGSCAMEEPFVGIKKGLRERSLREGSRYLRVGLAERGILPKERPNKYIEKLIVYPNMEERMEAFIRLASLMIIVPGGVGTAEEIMQLLGVVLYPENQGKQFDSHLIERPGGKWMESLKDLFDVCFPGLLDKEDSPIKIYTGVSPGIYGYELASLPNPTGHPWNDRLVFPNVISKGFQSHDPQGFLNELEGLRFSRSEHQEYSLAADLRKLFSAVVDVTVKYPEIFKEWESQGQKVHLNGQQEEINAIKKFLDVLYSQNRLAKDCPTRRQIFAD